MPMTPRPHSFRFESYSERNRTKSYLGLDVSRPDREETPKKEEQGEHWFKRFTAFAAAALEPQERSLEPYRALLCAMLYQAILDLKRTNRRNRKLAAWWFTDDSKEPWSYLWVLENLGWECSQARKLRAAILNGNIRPHLAFNGMR
jgi:hypothetical protein